MSTFLELQTEFYARGFNDLQSDAAGTTRVKAWINEAYHEICDEEDWSFLEADSTGAAPLTISDLRKVCSVVNTTAGQELDLSTREALSDVFGTTLTGTGTPRWYYIDAGTIVRAYPVGGSLAVRYYKVPTSLSADGDEPVVPERFHWLITAGAVRRGYQDRHNPQAAEAVEVERQRGLMVMKKSLLVPARPSPDVLAVRPAPPVPQER